MLNFYNTSKEYEKLIKSVYKAALKSFSQPDIFLLEVETVCADDMRETNRETRGVEDVTDVLSFPALDLERNLPVKKSGFSADLDYETGKIILGEIIICKERALAQAEEYGHSPERETAYLFLHGLLHLFGYDHLNEADKAEMRAKEEEILSRLNITRE